jgi:hypothetical protein
MEMKKLLSLTLILFATVAVFAQQEWESGEIKDVQIEIVKDRQIVLPQANRLFEKISPRPVENARQQVSYDFKAFNFSTPELSPVIRPLRLKQEDPTQAYRGYVSGGYGNYATPYLDAFITSKQDKKKLIGAHAYYRNSGKGPVDGENSGGGTSGISAFAQTFSKELSFNGNVGYKNRSTHFYGYPEDAEVKRDTIKQKYSLFNIGLGLANARNSAFAYQVGGNFSHLKDDFQAAESAVDFTFKGSYKFSDSKALQIHGAYAILNRKDVGVDAKARNLFQANGGYSFSPIENLKLQIGASVAIENDTLDSKSFHFYPDIKATYPISDIVDFVGSLSGGMEKVSLQSLSNENLWLAPAVALSHTNKVFDLQAGLRAKLGSTVLVGAGLSVAFLKDMYFFINDPEDASKFLVAYDDVRRTNLYASLLFTHSDNFRLSIQGDYFGYNTDKLDAAYHKPGYRVTSGVSYNMFKKLIFNVDVIMQGNMKALDPVKGKKNLDAAFDLNFRTEYLVSDRFSVFLELNNITGNKYPMFLNYPVRGFQGLGGLTWKF